VSFLEVWALLEALEHEFNCSGLHCLSIRPEILLEVEAAV
jgi:hypothetical protein